MNELKNLKKNNMKKYILLLFTTLSFAQASNQMVTFTQAQSLGFALKAGQSHVTSNQCMTKADILAKYNVTISGYADNQLVPRGAWVGAPVVTSLLINTSFYNSTSEACISSLPHVYTKYTINGLVLGAKIYSDQACTIEYIQNTGLICSAIEGSVKKAYRLDSNRVVDYVESCP